MQLHLLKFMRQPSIRIGRVMRVITLVFLVASTAAWASGIGQRDIFVGQVPVRSAWEVLGRRGPPRRTDFCGTLLHSDLWTVLK